MRRRYIVRQQPIRRRKIGYGRIFTGAAFFLVSHMLIIEGLVHGMTAQHMLKWLGISFGVLFVIGAFIDLRS